MAANSKKWFFCPVCACKIAKTDERSKGGTFLPCRFHKGEVEIYHQTDEEQREIIERVEKIKELKRQLRELQGNDSAKSFKSQRAEATA